MEGVAFLCKDLPALDSSRVLLTALHQFALTFDPPPQMAEGDQDKISCKDRWGGTPLGDAERGLDKNPPGTDLHEQFKHDLL